MKKKMTKKNDMECIFFPYFSEIATLEIFPGYDNLLTTDLERAFSAGIVFAAENERNRRLGDVHSKAEKHRRVA